MLPEVPVAAKIADLDRVAPSRPALMVGVPPDHEPVTRVELIVGTFRFVTLKYQQW